MLISIELAGLTARVKLQHPGTASFLAPYTVTDDGAGFDLAVTESDARLGSVAAEDQARESYLEHALLVLSASRFLLPRGRIVFHAVALRARGRAWLLTAPSGTGKTTQYLLLKRLYPEAIEIISGDKPILELREDELPLAHPSPWPGKEGYQGSSPGAVCGIVLLKQAEDNEIVRLAPRDAVFPLYREFLYSPENETDARMAAAIEEQLLHTVPVYEFRNRGDEASAHLLFGLLSQERRIRNGGI